MERQHVNSSNIDSIGYDESTQTLEIEFIDGGIYQYYGISRDIFENIMKADSCGAYFHAHIKNVYNGSKIQ